MFGLDSSFITTILYLVALVAIFYFLVLRPQQKKQKEAVALRARVKEGDKIVTIGGVVGKVTSVKEDVIVIETGNSQVKTSLTIMKWALGNIEKA